MRKTLLAAAALALLIPGRALGGTPGYAGANFLKFGQGARAAGMGESHVAVAEDAYAAYWNPAGLGLVRYPSLSMSYNRALEGVDQQYLSFAYPVRNAVTVDLNLTRLGMKSFQGYDAQGTPTRGIDSSDHALGLAAGGAILRDRRERPVLLAGVNVKGVQERLDRSQAATAAADLGVMLLTHRGSRAAQQADAGVRFGAAVRNLGAGLRYDRDAAPLPRSYHLGVAWRGYPRGDAATVSLDGSTAVDEGFVMAAGLEYTVFRVLALRLGYRTSQQLGTGFRGGLGFKLKVAELDYAFAGFGDLGQMHRMGLSFRLGGPVPITPPEVDIIAAALEKGKRLMKEGRHYDAVLVFDDVLKMDPGNMKALELMREAHDKLRR